jgi:hypothetical protein
VTGGDTNYNPYDTFAWESPCTCESEGDNPGCPEHGRDEPEYYTPQPIGPQLPVALCKCGHKLTFEQMRWRGRLVISTGWRCHCEGCVDGEYVGDPLQLQMTVVSGEGESPWEALDDLAAMHFDLMPEHLLVKEGP